MKVQHTVSSLIAAAFAAFGTPTFAQVTPPSLDVDFEAISTSMADLGWSDSVEEAAFILSGGDSIQLINIDKSSIAGTGTYVVTDYEDLPSRNTFAAAELASPYPYVTITSRAVILTVYPTTSSSFFDVTGVETTITYDDPTDNKAAVVGVTFAPFRLADTTASAAEWAFLLESPFNPIYEYSQSTPCRNQCNDDRNISVGICKSEHDAAVGDCYLIAAAGAGASTLCGPFFLVCLIADAGILDYCLGRAELSYDNCVISANQSFNSCIGGCP